MNFEVFDGMGGVGGRGEWCGFRTKNFESRSFRRNTPHKFGSQLDNPVRATNFNMKQQDMSICRARMVVTQLHVQSAFVQILYVSYFKTAAQT